VEISPLCNMEILWFRVGMQQVAVGSIYPFLFCLCLDVEEIALYGRENICQNICYQHKVPDNQSVHKKLVHMLPGGIHNLRNQSTAQAGRGGICPHCAHNFHNYMLVVGEAWA